MKGANIVRREFCYDVEDSLKKMGEINKMFDNLQKFSKYITTEEQVNPISENIPSQRDILREIFQRGPLSPIEISVATYSSLTAVENAIEHLQKKKLIRKFQEIGGQQFYSLSYKGRKKLNDPNF